MTKKNRRFPFERTKEYIFIENFQTNENQLYSMIRQYASICRQQDVKQARSVQQKFIFNKENDRLEKFLQHLKQFKENSSHVDTNDLSTLRYNHIQYWKTVRYQWQKYYRDEMKNQEEIFNNVRKDLS